jgi:hypothetical protein
MINLPPRLSLAEAPSRISGRVCLWVSPSVRAWVELHFPWPVQNNVTLDVDWLVVVGGGQIIDKAKAIKLAHPHLNLAIAPSLWGSGAEASPIIVSDDAGFKRIRIDSAALPELILDVPELAASVPVERARLACGDAWSHALEGLLSPLASEVLRADLCEVIRSMSLLSFEPDPRWFMLSALACAGQAKSSVGLIHGIAHELEGPLRKANPYGPWFHARLCSIFLLPVMRYNASRSDKLITSLKHGGVDVELIWQRLTELHDHAAYLLTLPTLREHWRRVLINPCSRTNSTIVNDKALDFLEGFQVT